jgi:periplasmic divalent cation tolerance protein
MDQMVVVLTTLPDRTAAVKLAEQLVAQRLAACVNVLAECTSVFHWKGAMESAAEVPVIIKTRAALYPQLEIAIRKLHPYELPEIIAVPVVRGLGEYLKWVTDETAISTG